MNRTVDKHVDGAGKPLERRPGRDARLAKHDGRDEVVVRVTDFPDDDHFEIPAEPARALDVGSVQMVPRAATW